MRIPNAFSNPPAISPLPVPAISATSVRWRMIAIVMFIMAVTALCRLNLSIAAKYIQDEFSYSTLTVGWLFSAFLLGYAVFQVPWGYFGDRFGPRRILTISILFWTLGTAAMGIAPRLAVHGWLSVLWVFIAIRFLTGTGEAAVSPNGTRVIALWTSEQERGLASGLQIAGLGLGGTLTPVLISWTMVYWGWRASFYLCAGLGLILLGTWRFYATDRPEDHPAVNAAELEIIRPAPQRWPTSVAGSSQQAPVPWRRMIRNNSVLSLVFAYGLHGYAFYVYYNWFYLYAVKVRSLSLMQAAVWTSTPFLAMTVLSPLGGLFADRISGKLGKKRGRQCAVWLGMGLSATLLYVGSHDANTSVALPLIAVAGGLTMFAGANYWAACIDLAPSYSASLSALMNTLGNLGGWISPILTAYVATRYGWSHSLDLAALITVCSGLLWLFVDAGASIEPAPIPTALQANEMPGSA
jgi:MFS transporter, ACS family, glucarate transporter